MTTQRYFSVRNFERFQHYKDRSPPWIKLYNAILDDYEFTSLPDAARAHLLLIWLLASRMDNKLPWDAEWVAKRIHANVPIDLDALATANCIVAWSEKEARGKQEDWPSRYISHELRAEVLDRDKHQCSHCGAKDHLEIDHITPISKGGAGSIENLQVLCRSCNRRKRAEQVATQKINRRSPEREKRESREREEVEKKEVRATRGTRLPEDWQPDINFALSEGMDEQRIGREADKFRDYWRSAAGQRGVKLDWDATWRNWARRAAGERQRPDDKSPDRRRREAFYEGLAVVVGRNHGADRPLGPALPKPPRSAS